MSVKEGANCVNSNRDWKFRVTSSALVKTHLERTVPPKLGGEQLVEFFTTSEKMYWCHQVGEWRLGSESKMKVSNKCKILQVPFFDLEDPHHNQWVLFQSIVNPTPPVYLRRFLSHNCALEVFGGRLCATSCNRQ